ncbi:MAG: hypothetical protein CSH37_10175 [Thalassolituus sp.]|nr:MAG: hypothetical protein CSH37_10175 [Thalassolituus sp.]
MIVSASIDAVDHSQAIAIGRKEAIKLIVNTLTYSLIIGYTLGHCAPLNAAERFIAVQLHRIGGAFISI